MSLVLAYLEVNDENLPHRLKNVYETAGPARYVILDEPQLDLLVGKPYRQIFE